MFFFVVSSFQESFFFFFDTVFEFNFLMSNLCSFMDTQNLNYFLSSSKAVYLNDNQFEINDNFLNTVSKNLYQCNYFDIHSQCFRVLKNQLFLLHVNIRSLQKSFESFLDFLQTLKKNCLT